MAKLNECVVIDTIRTPIGKSSRSQMAKLGGVFRECSAQDLLVTVLQKLIERTKDKCPDFDPKEIEDCHVGCLSQIGEQGGNIGRLAVLLSGLPHEIAGATVDRYCNAGLQAVNTCANAIKVGDGDIMIAAGLESMTHYSMGVTWDVCTKVKNFPLIYSQKMMDLMKNIVPQGESAEMICDRYGFTREQMDKFGAWSHVKATKAMRNEDEYYKRVVPVTYLKKYTDEKMKPIIDEQTSKQKARHGEAKASFGSIQSRSSTVISARFKALLLAGIGAVNMIFASSPATAVDNIRAIGFNPNDSAFSSDIKSVAAAPSTICDELPAVTLPPFLGERNTGLRDCRVCQYFSGSSKYPGRTV